MNYKTMIAPIVAVIALAINAIFKVEIGDELQAEIVNVVGTLIFVGISVYGVFKNHKKEDDK